MRKARGTARRWGRFFGFIALTIGIGGMGALGIDRTFRIQKVEVIGEGIHIAVDPRRLDRNLLFFPTNKLTDELRHTYPELATIEIRKKYPQTLVIIASLRSPIARLHTDTQEYALDRNGVVLSVSDSSVLLPRIDITLPPHVPGDTIYDSRIELALAFIDALSNTAPVERIFEKDKASLQARIGETDIFIPQNGDPRVLAATLQTLISGFRIKGSLPAIIDLRFDKPIVTF